MRKKGKGGTRYQNSQFYFREGFCWTDIHTTYIKSRLKESGIYDVKSMSLFSLNEKTPDWYIVCLLNSKYINEYVEDFINSTQTFQINDARILPILIPSENQLKSLQILFEEAINIKKDYFNHNIDKKVMENELNSLQDSINQEIYKLYDINIFMSNQKLLNQFCVDRNIKSNTRKGYMSAIYKYEEFNKECIDFLIEEAHIEEKNNVILKNRRL